MAEKYLEQKLDKAVKVGGFILPGTLEMILLPSVSFLGHFIASQFNYPLSTLDLAIMGYCMGRACEGGFFGTILKETLYEDNKFNTIF
jgi:hypothetical protein